MRRRLRIHTTTASSPAVLAAHQGVTNAVRDHGAFDAATREATALALAATNSSHYCQTAHTASGAKARLDPDTMNAIPAGQQLPGPSLQTVVAPARDHDGVTGLSCCMGRRYEGVRTSNAHNS